MPATAHTTSAKLLATIVIAPPVLVDTAVELDPVGDPPLPPTAVLLAVDDALVEDRVAWLRVVLRWMLVPVPAEWAAVPTRVGLDVTEEVEFWEAEAEADTELLLEDSEDDAEAEAETDEEPEDEPAGAPPVTVTMPV